MFCYCLVGFDWLLQKLMRTPSAEQLFPIPGEGCCNLNTIEPKVRLLVSLWFLATQDTIRSIAVMWVFILLLIIYYMPSHPFSRMCNATFLVRLDKGYFYNLTSNYKISNYTRPLHDTIILRIELVIVLSIKCWECWSWDGSDAPSINDTGAPLHPPSSSLSNKPSC